jgi:transposase
MSDTFSKVEVITGVARGRFTTEQKLAVVAETMQPGLSISHAARRHGLPPSLVFRWRRLGPSSAANFVARQNLTDRLMAR